MSEQYQVPVGFSDHSLGTEAAFLAVGAGACMIEKHFSLDPSRSGFDHHVSIDPKGLKALVDRVRLAEDIMGVPEKILAEAEVANRDKYQRCLVARYDLEAGHVLVAEDLNVMRVLPDQSGLLPADYEKVIGVVLARAVEKHTPFNQDMFA